MRRLLSLGRCGAQSLGCGRHPCLCADTSSTRAARTRAGVSTAPAERLQPSCPLFPPQLDTTTHISRVILNLSAASAFCLPFDVFCHGGRVRPSVALAHAEPKQKQPWCVPRKRSGSRLRARRARTKRLPYISNTHISSSSNLRTERSGIAYRAGRLGSAGPAPHATIRGSTTFVRTSAQSA